MADEVVGFGTALFGFSKKDVLTCIERLSAESQKAEQDARVRIESLQADLDNTRTENTSLRTKTEEKSAVVTQLMEQLNTTRRNEEETDARIAKLKDRVQDLDAKNQEYRRRLFQSEETVIRYQRKNSLLQQECDERQAKLDKQNAQMAELKQACETRLNEIGEEQEASIAKVKQEADQQIEALQQRLMGMQADPEGKALLAGADNVSQGLADVKRDLSDVGSKIGRLNEELQLSILTLQETIRKTGLQADACRSSIPTTRVVEPAAFPMASEPAAETVPVTETVHSSFYPSAAEVPAQAVSVEEEPVSAAAKEVSSTAIAAEPSAAAVKASDPDIIPEWQQEFEKAARELEPGIMPATGTEGASVSAAQHYPKSVTYSPETAYSTQPNMAERLLDSLSKMLNN